MTNAPWKSRIVGRADVDARSLKPHDENWRKHPEPQKRALSKVLGKVGHVQDVIVSKRTGKILDGHLRQELAAERGETIPVVYVDLTEQEEKVVLASFDSISQMAVSDDDVLRKLVGEIDVAGLELEDFFHQLVEPKTVVDPAGYRKAATGMLEASEKNKMIKPVLYADELATFERAIRMTKERNRGAALQMICQAYINSKANLAEELLDRTAG